MKRLFPYILILFFLFTACNSGSRNDQADDATVIPLNLSSPEKELALSEFVDSVSTIRLTLPDSLFFGQVSTVLFDKESIYIGDNKQNIVFRFNRQGKFLNTIGKKGGGPGEYTQLGRCFLGNDCLYIDDLAIRKIFSYTPEGKFIRTVSFPFSMVYDAITSLPNGDFLCYELFCSSGNPERGLWVMNANGEKTETILLEKEIYPYVGGALNQLSKDAQNIIHIYNSSTGKFYTYNPATKEFTKKYQIEPDIKLLSEFVGHRIDLKLKEKRTRCSMAIESDEYLFTIWSIFADTPQGKLVYALYNKQTQEVKTFERPQKDFPGLFFLGLYMSSNVPGALVGYLPDEYTQEKYPEEYKKLGMKENVLIVKVMHLK